MARLAVIFEADPDSAEGMEAELLVTLIEKYEKGHYPISLPDPIDAIRELMEMKALKDKDLIPAIGSKTTVSLELNCKRALKPKTFSILHPQIQDRGNIFPVRKPLSLRYKNPAPGRRW